MGWAAYFVAPRAGAWIEIVSHADAEFCLMVAPRAGAWIEIEKTAYVQGYQLRRTPCGCVD